MKKTFKRETETERRRKKRESEGVTTVGSTGGPDWSALDWTGLDWSFLLIFLALQFFCMFGFWSLLPDIFGVSRIRGPAILQFGGFSSNIFVTTHIGIFSTTKPGAFKGKKILLPELDFSFPP